MAMSLSEFGNKYQNIEQNEGYVAFVTSAIYEYVDNLYSQIKMSTPVLTGLAQSNWMITFNNSPTFTVPIGFNGAADEASYTMATIRSIHITNNVHYIGLLDSGMGSRQAPMGMVAPAIIQTSAWFGATARSVKLTV